jgi:hypothetical protein
MANGHGGARKGAGKPRGAKTRVTQEAIKRAGEGETPLEYMLRVMRSDGIPDERRDEMALAAAPYVHAKLQQIETKNETVVREFAAEPVTDDEWEQKYASSAFGVN